MSPCDIEFLLHCYYSSDPHENRHTTAIKEAIDKLLIAEMITPGDEVGLYKTTPRGEAHVRQLCYLPFPQHGWKGADGNMIPDN